MDAAHDVPNGAPESTPQAGSTHPSGGQFASDHRWEADALRAIFAEEPSQPPSAAAREERRRKVLKLRLSGVTHHKIAEMLGVTPGIVERDLRACRREVIAQAQPSRVWEIVADAHLTNQAVKEMAMVDALTAKPGTMERGKALDTLLRANLLGYRMWQDMQVIRRAPISLAAAVKDDPAIAALPPEDRQRALRGLFKVLLVLNDREGLDTFSGLASSLNGGDEIDVTPEDGGP